MKKYIIFLTLISLVYTPQLHANEKRKLTRTCIAGAIGCATATLCYLNCITATAIVAHACPHAAEGGIIATSACLCAGETLIVLHQPSMRFNENSTGIPTTLPTASHLKKQ